MYLRKESLIFCAGAAWKKRSTVAVLKAVLWRGYDPWTQPRQGKCAINQQCFAKLRHVIQENVFEVFQSI